MRRFLMKMLIKILMVVLYLVLWAAIFALLFHVAGCASVEYQDSECTVNTFTLGKDIVFDPNGMMSTVSPKNQGIIEALAGFAAGLLAGLL